MSIDDLRGPMLDHRRIEKPDDGRGKGHPVLEAPVAWKVTHDNTHGQLSEIDAREFLTDAEHLWRVL